jgi:hypothetical protein
LYEIFYYIRFFYRKTINRPLILEKSIFVKKIYAKIEARKKLEEEEELKKAKSNVKPKKKKRIKIYLVFNSKTGLYSKPKKIILKRPEKKIVKNLFAYNH